MSDSPTTAAPDLLASSLPVIPTERSAPRGMPKKSSVRVANSIEPNRPSDWEVVVAISEEGPGAVVLRLPPWTEDPADFSAEEMELLEPGGGLAGNLYGLSLDYPTGTENLQRNEGISMLFETERDVVDPRFVTLDVYPGLWGKELVDDDDFTVGEIALSTGTGWIGVAEWSINSDVRVVSLIQPVESLDATYSFLCDAALEECQSMVESLVPIGLITSES